MFSLFVGIIVFIIENRRCSSSRFQSFNRWNFNSNEREGD